MSYTGFKQAVYGILILEGAPHENVNTYSTPRVVLLLSSLGRMVYTSPYIYTPYGWYVSVSHLFYIHGLCVQGVRVNPGFRGWTFIPRIQNRRDTDTYQPYRAIHTTAPYLIILLRTSMKQYGTLAITRYSFISRLSWMQQPSFYPPPPTCIAHPGAILLHDYWAVYDSPSDLPFVRYTPYNISNNNIV